MAGARIIGVILMVVGALGLLYGGFSYTKEHTAAKVGPVELKVEQKETVNVPIWAGVIALAGGAVLLVGLGRK